ncbi:thiosulfate sulfurtransferase [Coprinopsis cinerea okayama7|uniref:Thiosulfate sulfurtransferase n=1 Tax=Coprinopsis cinerea (strain Okayama-7 / 130 / ATCC MYA-4618 / FGSC 9003) TaxID=240176 RepID=A8N0V5_COPC7|nr:thiosulfate sulfurtransferase [Coprinopsis cinerea okayama7\|eukprot:XP_001828506.2 thiosulfate sulfurtransferase [Coprinopsis cinerea okayama7\
MSSSQFGTRAYSSQRIPLVLSPQDVNNLRHSQQEQSDIALLDATWFMPNSPRNPQKEFLERRIPGAQRLDLDAVASEHELGLKHMMPSKAIFAKACGELGISPDSHVVIYDSHGVFSSPRALFMFRAFGHEKSSIINGGLPRWIDEGLPIDTEAPLTPSPVQYEPPPRFRPETVRSYMDVVLNSQFDPKSNALSELVLDARSKGRYLGTDPEPRPGLSSGHIPHSISLPFNLFLKQNKAQSGNLSSDYTTLLRPSEIRQVLEDTLGEQEVEDIIAGDRSVVASCGSGMTAGVLWLGLQLLGARKVAIYDESWTGYAMRPESKIVKSDGA